MTARTLTTGPELDALWREMHGPLTGFVARRVSDPRDAEDVVQDVMLRIHRHADDLADVEHLDAWIHQVARSAIVDFYRRRAARPETPADLTDGPEDALPGEDDVSEPGGTQHELAGCVSPLIARLPGKYREALELTEIGGLTQAEAARRLGLSASGMKARVQRARSRLRDLLLACCHVELDRRGGVTDYEPRPGGCGRCTARSER